MPTIDMDEFENRREAMAQGYIWQAPPGAVREALAEVAAGKYPGPDHIPAEWEAEARSLGVTAAAAGISEGSGPA